jgi:hypothetical protein
VMGKRGGVSNLKGNSCTDWNTMEGLEITSVYG